MILENSFIRTGKYGGVAIDIYQGAYKLVRAWEGQDGKIRADWAYPQAADNKPKKTAVPVGVELGDEPEKAIAVLKTFIKLIESSDPEPYPGGDVIPKENRGYEQTEDDIPF